MTKKKQKDVPKIPMTKDQATELEWHTDHAKPPEAPKEESKRECTDATCSACHPDLYETNGIPNDVEEALTIAEHLLLTRYRFTSKEARRFREIVRTQLRGGVLPTKKQQAQKTKTPIRTLLRTKPVAVMQPGEISPEQKKEIEIRTKKLEEELKRKGLLMEGRKEAQ